MFICQPFLGAADDFSFIEDKGNHVIGGYEADTDWWGFGVLERAELVIDISE